MSSFEGTPRLPPLVARASTLTDPGDHSVRTSSRSPLASSTGFFEAHPPRSSVRYTEDGHRDVISTSPSEYNAPNHERHPPLSIQIPPPAYSPLAVGSIPAHHGAIDRALPDRTAPGFPHMDIPMSPSASLSYSDKSIAQVVIDPEMQNAELTRRSTPLSCFHVAINALVFLASTGILVTTMTLFFLLRLDELRAANLAAFLAVLFSAASAASAIVTVYRLEKRVPPRGRTTWSTGMAIGVPLMFLTCAIIAFTTFLVGINLSSRSS